MTSVQLRYPAWPGARWAMWAELVGQIIRYYTDADSTEVVMICDPKLVKPEWTVHCPDFFLKTLIQMACATVFFLHQYRLQRTTTASMNQN